MPTDDLTTQEAAAALHVTRRAIQDWYTKGYFPHAYKLNPRARNSPVRIPRADVVAFERERGRERGMDDSASDRLRAVFGVVDMVGAAQDGV
ncbi:MAG: helix-turn-helix domain-containing protein [Chloroflexota bacterium]